MAKKTTPNKNIYINNIDVKPVNRGSIDIAKWRQALKSAESGNFSRQQLYDIYEDILLDGHLTSLINKRINPILNTEIKFFDFSGKENDEINKIINKSFFEKVIKEIINSKFWGFSLLELDWALKEGYENITYSINRKHVKPEFKLVVKAPGDTTGLYYPDNPYALFVGEGDYGLLLMAAPYVIYKRNNFSDWSEFNEVFGKPYIHGKYSNDETRLLLTEALQSAGFDQWMVTPDDAIIDITESSSKSTNQFDNFHNTLEKALSILILGQNLTTQVSGGSFAASKIHGEVEASINIADREFVIRTINQKLIPILNNIGYNLDGEFKFIYNDALALNERIVIDEKLNNIIDIEPDYFYESYGIPKPKNRTTEKKPDKKEKLSHKTDVSEIEITDQNIFKRFLSFFVKRTVLKF